MTGREVLVDRTLRFGFDSSWNVSKYDEWVFYRTVMMPAGKKAVDIVAVPGATAFLVEVKDYTHPESNPVPNADLPRTVAAKCADTLEGLARARTEAVDAAERASAEAVCTAETVRVVLHVELPLKRGRLWNRKGIRADMRTKLRRLVKDIDPHAIVESHDDRTTDWRVTLVRRS